MAKMYWWKSLTVTYQFHNLFGGILFLIEAVNWISGSYEHNKSDFFSADLTTDRIPRHCTISPSSFTQPSLGSSFTSKLGDCLTAFSSAPSHQGWSQACPKGHQLVEVGAQAPRGPPRLLWFLMISPIFIFPVCSSRNSPSSLHERFPSSKDVSDISTTRNPCSFPFWERLLLWCRRGFLSSGTLVLQPRICPAQRTGFLASSHQISPPPLFIFLSERWATEFAPPTLGPSLDGQVNEKSCSIDIPLRTHWNLITSCINVRAQWEKGPG